MAEDARDCSALWSVSDVRRGIQKGVSEQLQLRNLQLLTAQLNLCHRAPPSRPAPRAFLRPAPRQRAPPPRQVPQRQRQIYSVSTNAGLGSTRPRSSRSTGLRPAGARSVSRVSRTNSIPINQQQVASFQNLSLPTVSCLGTDVCTSDSRLEVSTVHALPLSAAGTDAETAPADAFLPLPPTAAVMTDTETEPVDDSLAECAGDRDGVTVSATCTEADSETVEFVVSLAGRAEPDIVHTRLPLLWLSPTVSRTSSVCVEDTDEGLDSSASFSLH